MEKELRCKICGCFCLGVIISTNINPICEKCIQDIIKTPHAIEIRLPVDSERLIYNSGISITSTISTSVSSPFSVDGDTIYFK